MIIEIVYLKMETNYFNDYNIIEEEKEKKKRNVKLEIWSKQKKWLSRRT
jgi:hypothetical protein